MLRLTSAMCALGAVLSFGTPATAGGYYGGGYYGHRHGGYYDGGYYGHRHYGHHHVGYYGHGYSYPVVRYGGAWMQTGPGYSYGGYRPVPWWVSGPY